MSENQNPVGRPSKIKNFNEAFEELLKKDEGQVVYLTDDELRLLCNDLLGPEHQINDATFENWKAGKIKDNPEYQKFLGLYKKALINQKNSLFNELKNDKQAWQRFAWIIERKFSEWNLRQIGEFKNENNNLNLNANVENLEKMNSKELEELRNKLIGKG